MIAERRWTGVDIQTGATPPRVAVANAQAERPRNAIESLLVSMAKFTHVLTANNSARPPGSVESLWPKRAGF
jgi:hypothetical protein